MAEVHSTPADSEALAPACSVRQIERVFGGKGNVTHALNGISFDVQPGEFVAIMGPSGSGKTTLLNCIATIDKPTGGSVIIDGVDTTRLKGGALARFRRERLGFIFQDSNLVETLTGAENIALPLSIRGQRADDIASRVAQVAARLGVEEVLEKFPGQMSGGQRQRVAAARAIAGKPQLILADEPTGALDSRNAAIMLETLEGMNRDMGATILMVTHDPMAASYASRVLFVKDGKQFTHIRKGAGDRAQSRKELFDRIMEVQALLSGGMEGGAGKGAGNGVAGGVAGGAGAGMEGGAHHVR